MPRKAPKLALTQENVLQRLRRQVRSTSLRQVADDLRVSSTYLSHVLSGQRRPGPKIYKAMGLRRELRFVER